MYMLHICELFSLKSHQIRDDLGPVLMAVLIICSERSICCRCTVSRLAPLTLT